MPWTTPTLEMLVGDVSDAFDADLRGSDAKLWPNNVAVSAIVIAGTVHPVYQYLDYIGRQRFAHLADGQFLDRHGIDWGLARHQATFAEGPVVFAGKAGTSIPAEVEIVRSDGRRYQVIAGGSVDGSGNITVRVRAIEPGRDGNAAAGVAMTLAEAITNVSSEGEVDTDGLGLGSDLESDANFRARILHRKQYTPMGGAAHDYVTWAKDVSGVSRVFVDPVTQANGRTTVGVWFLMDDVYVDGIPQATDVTAVAAAIDAERPAAAVIEVAAPAAQAINVEISNLSPDTVSVRNAIAEELTFMLRREGGVATLTDPLTIHRSLISEAISAATGEHHHTLVAPASDVAITTGSFPALGTLVFS